MLHKRWLAAVTLACSATALVAPRPALQLRMAAAAEEPPPQPTLAAETLAATGALDSQAGLRFRLNEIGYFPKSVMLTDCRSLYDAVHRLSTTFQEKRAEIDVAALRQTAKQLRWVPTSQQWADALTKRDSKLRNQLRLWMMDPQICSVETKSTDDDKYYD